MHDVVRCRGPETTHESFASPHLVTTAILLSNQPIHHARTQPMRQHATIPPTATKTDTCELKRGPRREVSDGRKGEEWEGSGEGGWDPGREAGRDQEGGRDGMDQEMAGREEGDGREARRVQKVSRQVRGRDQINARGTGGRR